MDDVSRGGEVGQRIRSGPALSTGAEVPMRTECDQCPTHTTRTRVSYISTDPHGRYKANDVNLDIDVEEKRVLATSDEMCVFKSVFCRDVRAIGKSAGASF